MEYNLREELKSIFIDIKGVPEPVKKKVLDALVNWQASIL